MMPDKPTFSYLFSSFSPVLIIIILFAFFIFWRINNKKQKASKKNLETSKMIDALKLEILVVPSSEIPGKNIKNVLGLVRGVSDTQASTKEEFSLSETEALYDMLKNAKNMGANAIIDAKVSTGTYQTQGSQWQVSQAIYTGTAIVVE
jgi:uncharacterized protein YbjQ (UPF0145 family)